MKKIWKGAVITALVLTVGASTAFAAGGRNFVDADGDGVCDHRGAYCQFVDADGDGVCDHRGAGCRGMGRGRHGC